MKESSSTSEKLSQQVFLRSVAAIFSIAGLLSFFYFDSRVAQSAKSAYGNPFHLLARATTDLGKAEYYIVLSFLLLAIGLARRQQRIRDLGLQAIKIFLGTGLLVQLLKHLIGRQRPYADLDLTANGFAPLNGNYEWHSLPSGHSQVVFSAAGFLILLFPKFRWLWLIFATWIAVTRVLTLNHWLSDAFAGATVGVLGVLLIDRFFSASKVAKNEP